MSMSTGPRAGRAPGNDEKMAARKTTQHTKQRMTPKSNDLWLGHMADMVTT
jgi:truncated hemoglobin YjbI